MRYFRVYPWGMQLALFLLMTFTFMSGISAALLAVLPKATGYSYADVAAITAHSAAGLRHTFLGVQGVQSLFTFLLPAAAFAYLATPRPAAYLGLRKPGKPLHWLLVVLAMAGAMPVLLYIQELMHHVNFGVEAQKNYEAQARLMEALITSHSAAELAAVFTVMAIIPGIGEELFFRGVLMRFTRRRSAGMVVPVLFTGVVFAFVHANVYGYASIFLAGVLLAVIYYLTGSLLCSIAGHMFFNGFQVLLTYMGMHNAAVRNFISNDTVPLALVAAGAAVCAAALFLLVKNATPLPPRWMDDYSPAEGGDTGNNHSTQP